MENLHNRRVSNVVIGALMFLLVALYSSPTTSSSPVGRPAPPTAQEIEVLAELSEWVLGGSSAPSFHAFSERTLPSALDGQSEPKPMGFELFRGFHDEERRQELVAQAPFGKLIATTAARHGLDPLLLVAMIQAESSFNPNAISVVGAIGLMQVLPTTVELFTDGDPFDPVVNLDVGARYMKGLLAQFEGDTALALAAYNAGPGNVLRHQGVPPFRETRRYVERVMSQYVDAHQKIWQESVIYGS